MSFDVKTRNALGKKVSKRDDQGRVITVDKIIPKERPRFGRSKGGKSHTFTPQATVDFEAWIRRQFFLAYPNSSGGVWWNNQGWAVHDHFLGCQWYGEDKPCARFKYGKNFMDCQSCTNRRKNLMLDLEVHLKDERHVDLDNYIKITLDALNRVMFYDDTQFIRKHAKLIPYSAQGEHLSVSIQALPAFYYGDRSAGSVVGGYSLKNMLVDKAQEYFCNLYQSLCSSVDVQHQNQKELLTALADYARRCDGRKYTQNLENIISERTAHVNLQQ